MYVFPRWFTGHVFVVIFKSGTIVETSHIKIYYIIKMNVYTIQKSKVKHKKYTAILKDGKKVHFGDNRYEQYKDSTPLKA